MLLVPFRPRAAHVVQFGAIVVEQRLSQRLPRREALGRRCVGGLSHFPRLCHLAYPRSHTVTMCFKRSFEIQTLVCDERMTGWDGRKEKIIVRPPQRAVCTENLIRI